MRPEFRDVIINSVKLYDRFRLGWSYPEGKDGPTYKEMFKILREKDIQTIVYILPQYFHLLYLCFDIIMENTEFIPLRDYLIVNHKNIVGQVFPHVYEIVKNGYDSIDMSWKNSGPVVWIEYLTSLHDDDMCKLINYIDNFERYGNNTDICKFSRSVYRMLAQFRMPINVKKSLARVSFMTASYHKGCLNCLLLCDDLKPLI